MQPSVFIKHLPARELTRVAERIDYPPHGMTQRPLSENDGLRIVLAAMRTGVCMDIDAGAGQVMVQILEGGAEIGHPARPIRLAEHQVIILPEGATHALTAIHNTKCLLTYILQPDTLAFADDNL